MGEVVKRGKKTKTKSFFFFKHNGLEILQEPCLNYFICFWIHHWRTQQGWTSCGRTLKISITAPGAAASENPWMSSRLHLHRLQTVKELTRPQELNSCWQKDLSEEAAPWGIHPTNNMIFSPCAFLFPGPKLYHHCTQKLVSTITTTTTTNNAEISFFKLLAPAWGKRRGGDGRERTICFTSIFAYPPWDWQSGRYNKILSSSDSGDVFTAGCLGVDSVALAHGNVQHHQFFKDLAKSWGLVGSGCVCRCSSLSALFPSSHRQAFHVCLVAREHHVSLFFFIGPKRINLLMAMEVSDCGLLSETVLKGSPMYLVLSTNSCCRKKTASIIEKP